MKHISSTDTEHKTYTASHNVPGLVVSNSQVIGCEDRLQNDLYCVGWGFKLYSIQSTPGLATTPQYSDNNCIHSRRFSGIPTTPVPPVQISNTN